MPMSVTVRSSRLGSCSLTRPDDEEDEQGDPTTSDQQRDDDREPPRDTATLQHGTERDEQRGDDQPMSRGTTTFDRVKAIHPTRPTAAAMTRIRPANTAPVRSRTDGERVWWSRVSFVRGAERVASGGCPAQVRWTRSIQVTTTVCGVVSAAIRTR